MARRLLVFSWLLLLAFSIRLEAQVAPDESTGAHQLVGDTINALLKGIAHSKAGKGIDGSERVPKQAIVETVDAVLGEVIDFKRIARRVMAKHYKKANDQQRTQFTKAFRTSLLQTYAAGLQIVARSSHNLALFVGCWDYTGTG